MRGTVRRDLVGVRGSARSIGIDDGSHPSHAHPVPDPTADAERFAELFRTIYLAFHRRDGKREGLTGASRAVLTHLAMTGPLTVGEAARHLDRAQSVVSEIVDGLEAKGLLERERDPADGRRTLVWLTADGQEALRRDREVLSVSALASALADVPPAVRAGLIDGAAALAAAAPSTRPTSEEET
jgi:DNA-binding MarR family transcriptional regulator